MDNRDVLAYHQATGCPVLRAKARLGKMQPELRERVMQAVINFGAAPSRLLIDPIEKDPQFADAIKAAFTEAEAIVRGKGLTGRGSCHALWREQERILCERNIRWYSPKIMNPDIRFD